MKKTIAILTLSAALATTLTSASVLPAWSAMRTAADGISSQPFAEQITANQEGMQSALPHIYLSEYESEDDDGYSRSSGGDDDYNRSSYEDDDDECEGGCGANTRNPAPAGSVTPPKNGLFDTQAAPKVQMN